ncbi:MAG: hypothetical protein J0I93_11270 [Legionella sp.]|nr:hypothetical protein [Legionella sp.]
MVVVTCEGIGLGYDDGFNHHTKQCRFFKTLPKTVDEIMLWGNRIGHQRTSAEVRELFAL